MFSIWDLNMSYSFVCLLGDTFLQFSSISNSFSIFDCILPLNWRILLDHWLDWFLELFKLKFLEKDELRALVLFANEETYFFFWIYTGSLNSGSFIGYFNLLLFLTGTAGVWISEIFRFLLSFTAGTYWSLTGLISAAIKSSVATFWANSKPDKMFYFFSIFLELTLKLDSFFLAGDKLYFWSILGLSF